MIMTYEKLWSKIIQEDCLKKNKVLGDFPKKETFNMLRFMVVNAMKGLKNRVLRCILWLVIINLSFLK